MEIDVGVFECLIGIKKNIKLLNGKTVCIISKPNEVVKNNTVRRVKGLGMPRKELHGKCGDLLIRFNCVFPRYIEEYERKVVNKIFEKQKKNSRNNSKKNENGGKEKEEIKDKYFLEKTDKKIEDFNLDSEEEEKKKKFDKNNFENFENSNCKAQ